MTEKAISRVLIQTVGTGGPHNPVWEALVFSVRECRPDVLVQWCSKETLEKTVPRFEACLGKADRPGEIRRSACADPDNVDSLVLDYLAQIDSLRAEFPNAVLEVDFTSGTKPMSAAAVAAAVARRLPQLHYAVGPRDESGRVVKTESLMSLDTGQMVAERLLCELGGLFNRGQFTAVCAQAESLVPDLIAPTLRARAESLAYLAKVYELWDRFAWDKAFCLLRDYEKREKKSRCLSCAGWDCQKLAVQLAHVKRCKDGNVRPQRLADLLANAKRRIDQGRYDDAAARLYRLTEYIAQVRFRVQFGIPKPDNPTSNVDIEVLARHAPRLAETLGKESPLVESRLTLGLRHTIDALAEAQDPIGRLMKDRYDAPNPDAKGKGPLGELLDARNQSLLAHGAQPIQEQVATALCEEVTAILAEHFRIADIELAELLKAATFLACPWV